MMILTRREFAAAGMAVAAASLAATATPASATALPADPKVDPLSLVDPELRPTLQEMSKLFPDVPWSDGSLLALRQGGAAWEKSPAHLGAFTWKRDANRYGWASLQGVPAGAAKVPRGAVPAREASVPTELVVAPGGFHGFDVIVPQATISRQFTTAWNDALSRGLQPKQTA